MVALFMLHSLSIEFLPGAGIEPAQELDPEGF